MSESNGYVKSSIFRMAMLILVAAISGLFGLYIAQVGNIADLRVDMATVKSDTEWIRSIVQEGKSASLRNFDGNEATLNLAVGREKMKEKLDLVLKNGQIKLK